MGVEQGRHMNKLIMVEAGQVLNVLDVWTIFNVLHVLYNFSDMTMCK